MVVGFWNMMRERREGFIAVQSDVLDGVNW